MEVAHETNFKELSDGDFILKLKSLGILFDVHPAYQTSVPVWVPGGGHFRRHADNLEQAVAAAATDKSKDEERIGIREQGAKAINFASSYVAMYAAHHQDPGALLNLGLELKHKTYNRDASKKLPLKPTKFSAKDDEGVGNMVAFVNNGFGKGSVQLQITDQEPQDEASWRTVGHFYKCRMEVKGLEPVKRYYLRARFRNAAGNGPWSDVISLVVT